MLNGYTGTVDDNSCIRDKLWPEILPDLFVFGTRVAITPVMRIPENDVKKFSLCIDTEKMSETHPMFLLVRSEINQQREIRISKRTRGERDISSLTFGQRKHRVRVVR
jgi:hypothetical protein